MKFVSSANKLIGAWFENHSNHPCFLKIVTKYIKSLFYRHLGIFLKYNELIAPKHIRISKKIFILVMGSNPTRVLCMWLFSQDSGKYWVYSANTHRCKWVKTKMNTLYSECKFKSSKVYLPNTRWLQPRARSSPLPKPSSLMSCLSLSVASTLIRLWFIVNLMLTYHMACYFIGSARIINERTLINTCPRGRKMNCVKGRFKASNPRKSLA